MDRNIEGREALGSGSGVSHDSSVPADYDEPVTQTTYDVSAALGSPIPAPINSEVVIVEVNETGGLNSYNVFKCICQDRESGEKTLAAYCLNDWSTDLGSAPWLQSSFYEKTEKTTEEEAKKAWLETATPKSLIREYFKNSYYTYKIEAFTVRPALDDWDQYDFHEENLS